MAQDTEQLSILNTLRSLFNPPDDANFELHLNKHPKNHKDKSLTYALNMKVSDDGTVLENDESIKYNNIGSKLESFYSNYKIIHIIPCNTELVLFVVDKSYTAYNRFDIWRYREKDNVLALFYDKHIPYYNGKFSSSFTYTSNDNLILAFCEYDSNPSNMNPMMTINLGTFTKGHITSQNDYTWISENNEFNDRGLELYKLPLCPEVSLPQINKIEYHNNSAYQGYYIPYIRYKINEYDYTQWIQFGHPIVNNIIEPVKLHVKNSTNIEGKDELGLDCVNAHKTSRPYAMTGYFSKNVDVIYNSINLTITHLEKKYNYYQLGFICIAKTYTKYFVSKDIVLDYTTSFEVSLNNLIEEQFNINKYENYFNVKNIVNKNNKLYISNYEVFNDNIDYSDIVNNIKLKLIKGVDININDYINNTKTEYDLDFNGIRIPINNLLYSRTLYSPYINVPAQYGETFPPINTYLIHLALILKDKGYESFITQNITVSHRGMNDTELSRKTGSINDLFIGTSLDYISRTNGVANFMDYYDLNEREKQEYLTEHSDDWNTISNISNFNSSTPDWTYQEVVHGFNIIQVPGVSIPEPQRRKVVLINANNEELDIRTLGDIRYLNPYDLISSTNKYNTVQTKINSYIPSSLVQGEIYDFYIHFVDKYGNTTKGFKINNENSFDIWKRCEIRNLNKIVVDTDIVFFTRAISNSTYETYCFKNQNVFNDDGSLKQFGYGTNLISVYKVDNGRTFQFKHFDEDTKEVIGNLIGVSTDSIYNTINNTITNLQYLEDKTIKFSDIFDSYPYTVNKKLGFYKYKNSNEDTLFKVPVFSPLIDTTDIIDSNLGLLVEDLEIPINFDYYFISAKKHENTYTLDGSGNQIILFNDYINLIREGNIGGSIVKVRNFSKSADSYSTEFTLNKNNIRQVINNISPITNINISYAGETQKNRIDKGSCIYLTNGMNDINLSEVNYVEIININKHIYEAENDLYRISDYLTINDTRIYDGFNGRFTRSSCMKYGESAVGVSICTTGRGTGAFGDVMYCQIFGYYHINQESLYLTKSGKSYTKNEIYYAPIDTLGLYDTKLLSFNEMIIEAEYAFKNQYYLNEFNRTVYRSNVISDETRLNNWRFFETDAYRNIEENKGNITNLVNIGNYLYVHTEHSLFAFSDDNTLKAENQSLQFNSPDTFDVDYKEQFRTTLGYGGLQDKEAWIAGEFGYLYYNNDNREIIKLYGNSLDIISKDIKEWLVRLNPNNVRFIQDIKNSRVFIQFIKNNTKIVLSYNYKYGVFVSVHDYNYYKGFNTKNNLYLLETNNNNNRISIYKENEYGYNINTKKQYKISFIINTYYKSVKYLENIRYKLRKRDGISDLNIDINEFPVEKNIIPYSGSTLRVHNNLIDTGIMDINSVKIDDNTKPYNDVTNYDKPYLELDVWNFNNLRDIHNRTYTNHDEMSRLYGNYFIIAFEFNDVTNLIEFENLQVSLTEDKKL